jgi:hypothetical protein
MADVIKKALEEAGRRLAEQRELEKLLPLARTKPWRRPLPEKEQWTREQRQELARMAEEHLKKNAAS